MIWKFILFESNTLRLASFIKFHRDTPLLAAGRFIRGAFLLLLGFCGFAMSGCNYFDKDNTTPPSALISFEPKMKMRPMWKEHVANGAEKYYLRLKLASDGKNLFVDDYGGNVVAVDRQTGQFLWEVNVGSKLSSGVTYGAGKLFVATENGHVIALDAKDGKQIWQVPVSSEILATPTAAGSKVLVKSIDGALVALSMTDGGEIWRFTQSVPSLTLHSSSQPVVAGDYVISGFANGNLAVLNLADGKPLWVRPVSESHGTTDVERMVDIDVTPIVVNGIIYVATYQGNVMALELKTGREIWEHQISAYAGLAADGKQLYVSDSDSDVWGFDEDAGAVMWRQNHLSGRMITGPVIFGNSIIVADGYGYVHWLSKYDGSFLARESIDRTGVLADPLVVGDSVYIYTKNGMMFAFQKV